MTVSDIKIIFLHTEIFITRYVWELIPNNVDMEMGRGIDKTIIAIY